MFANTISVEKTFAALADRTRLTIIERLATGETALSDLAKPFEMSQTAVSKHVRILSEAGLVKISKRGRTRYCEFLPEPMEEAEQWLETYQKFWSERFDNLANYLDEERSETND